MAFKKFLVLLLLTFSTMTMAAANTSDDDWEIHCVDDECMPKTSKVKRQTQRFLDFSSYAYKKVTRGIMDRHPKLGVFVGPYLLKGGAAQDVPIVGIIGDTFSLDEPTSTSGMAGFVILADSLEFEHDNYALKYAFSSYYFGTTTVQGLVTQEQLVTNLDYAYKLTNTATYVGLRLLNLLDGRRCNLTFDAGVGLNQVQTNFFIETPLVNYAVPDNAFRAANTNQFSFMFGAGVQLQNALGKQPLGCGYSFFYLGEGKLDSINTRIPSALKTGKMYANSILCSIQLG